MCEMQQEGDAGMSVSYRDNKEWSRFARRWRPETVQLAPGNPWTRLPLMVPDLDLVTLRVRQQVGEFAVDPGEELVARFLHARVHPGAKDFRRRKWRAWTSPRGVVVVRLQGDPMFRFGPLQCDGQRGPGGRLRLFFDSHVRAIPTQYRQVWQMFVTVPEE